jgi:hypothetical protein
MVQPAGVNHRDRVGWLPARFTEDTLMASKKKQRKAKRQTKKALQPRTSPFRHPDGDRRHRGSMTYEQGIAIKRTMQQFGAECAPQHEEE